MKNEHTRGNQMTELNSESTAIISNGNVIKKRPAIIGWRGTFGVVITVSLLLLFFNGELIAQPGLPGDPAQAPIDGGLGLLIAAGGMYAVKKLRNKKNE